MIKVLADSECLLAYFINQSNSIKKVERLLKILKSDDIEIFFTDKSLKDLHFYLSKPTESFGDTAIQKIKDSLKQHIIIVDDEIINKARTIQGNDFDAAVEIICALEKNLGAIVTLNPQKYAQANLNILSIDDFFKTLNLFYSIKNKPNNNFLNQWNWISKVLNNNFENRKLEKIDISNGDFTSSDFTNCNLTEANLKKTILNYSNLKNTILYGADLNGCQLIRATLEETNLAKSDLRNAIFNSAYLNGANIFRANVKNTIFDYATIKNSDLTSVNFSSASVKQTVFENNIGIDRLMKNILVAKGAIFFNSKTVKV